MMSQRNLSIIVTPGLTRGLPCLEEKGGSRIKSGMTKNDVIAGRCEERSV